MSATDILIQWAIATAICLAIGYWLHRKGGKA